MLFKAGNNNSILIKLINVIIKNPQMKLGVYLHVESPISKEIGEEFAEKGFEVSYGDCLCKDELKEKLKGLPELVLLHPSSRDDNFCWSTLRNIILENPSKKFYIFALESPERVEGIGIYDNVRYITRGNSTEVLTELFMLKE